MGLDSANEFRKFFYPARRTVGRKTRSLSSGVKMFTTLLWKHANKRPQSLRPTKRILQSRLAKLAECDLNSLWQVQLTPCYSLFIKALLFQLSYNTVPCYRMSGGLFVSSRFLPLRVWSFDNCCLMVICYIINNYETIAYF